MDLRRSLSSDENMRFRMIFSVVFLVSAFVVASAAYAGKAELTTYYPAPYGEYKDIKASNSLQVPVKTVGGDPVNPGEIWIDPHPCPTGQSWDGDACA